MQTNILHTARQILNVGAGSDEMPCGCHGESKNTMLRKSVLPNIIIGQLAKFNYLTEFAITLQQSKKTHHHQLMNLMPNAELRSSNQVNQLTQHHLGNDAQ